MRLINTTSLELKEFMGEPTNPRFPRYAILSHTWEAEEVTFQDIQQLDVARKKAGFSKIAKCCEVALSEGLAWAWVDTCCIDKSNSAELSEGVALLLKAHTILNGPLIIKISIAINSMFKWYEAATICYAYLSDVGDATVGKHYKWKDSRWFTRGWTLQELVAPFEVIIYDYVWKQLGTKRRWTKELSEKTNVPEGVLLYPSTRREHSVAVRMSWAMGRQTTRIEDRAYSLLGIFDITNMPLVYGEGKKSFSRLHHEIMNTHQDDTIFLGGLASEDVELDKLSSQDLESSMDGQGFLTTPENVPVPLTATINPPTSTETEDYAPQPTPHRYTAGGPLGIWERKDPRLRGDTLSLSLRIIQISFHRHGTVCLQLTKKRQSYVELNPESRKFLEDFDTCGVKAKGGSLCLGVLRCGTKDGKLVARYFLCLSAHGELWAHPTGVYRYVTQAEVENWPSLQCHILLGRDAWKPYPVLEPLRDAASWESEPQSKGDFGNGWVWEDKSINNTQDITHDPGNGEVRKGTHCYQLSFHPGYDVWDLNISVITNKHATQGRGISDVYIEIVLQYPAAPDLEIQSTKAKHNSRHGLVVELCHRLPVLDGSAELVVSVSYGIDGETHYYSPMVRFRAFEPRDSQVLAQI